MPEYSAGAGRILAGCVGGGYRHRSFGGGHPQGQYAARPIRQYGRGGRHLRQCGRPQRWTDNEPEAALRFQGYRCVQPPRPANEWSGHTQGYVPIYTDQAASFVAARLLAVQPPTTAGPSATLAPST